jgi:hypothetical protein
MKKGWCKMERSSSNRIRLMSVGFIAAIMLGGIELANGATITVGPGEGCDFDTIHAGIDAAIEGDTVLVAPGEYVISEPITFRGKAITVRAEAGPDETTIRMGTPTDPVLGSVVVFENNETAASALDGFTITGGRGSGPQNASGGGGILFDSSSGTVKNCAIVQNRAAAGSGIMSWDNSSATVRNCTITGNSAMIIGGGVYAASGSSLTLTNCTIKKNSATRSGGGVACWENSSAILVDCIIRGNSATGVILHMAGYGGGLYAGQNSMLTVTNCNIAENSAGVGGGGILLTGSPSSIVDCIISRNSAGWWGGGVACENDTMLMSITNCVINRNTAGEGGGGVACALAAISNVSNCTIWGNSGGTTWGGGGMLCLGSATINNSIIWANTSPKGHEMSVEDPGSTLTISYSDVAGGQAEVHVQDVSTLDWGEGNIDADPCFADPENDDYHLKSEAGRWDSNRQLWVRDDITSPCIDAGDPMSPIDWEPFPNGGFINMGAYAGTSEASKTYFGGPICETIVAGDINGDCKVDRVDLEIMALHWTDEEPLTLP